MDQLQRLAMTEVGLKRMSGIEHCHALTHLDLSHNKLTEMEKPVLTKLTKLQTLWLNENAIERMQGLDNMTQLTQLWLGANRIGAICDALANCSSLEELNLAGNLISNFKDIPNLARMRRLATVSFNEPHFGDNPLCALCNYQTYLLFHMTHLRMFDSVVITDELRQLAEAVRESAAQHMRGMHAARYCTQAAARRPPHAGRSTHASRSRQAASRKPLHASCTPPRLRRAISSLPRTVADPCMRADPLLADVHEEEDVLQHAHQDPQTEHLQRHPQSHGGAADQGESDQPQPQCAAASGQRRRTRHP